AERATLFPYTTLFRSNRGAEDLSRLGACNRGLEARAGGPHRAPGDTVSRFVEALERRRESLRPGQNCVGRDPHINEIDLTLERRSEEHTSELQSRFDL